MFEKTAFDLFTEEIDSKSIVTLCKDLDDAIESGFPLGKITEVVGPPGSGKTQLCLQLCVNVQIPSKCFGIGGSAIFIDTNFGFTTNRLKEIANATCRHCHRICRNCNINPPPDDFTIDDIFRNVFVTHCKNISDLLVALKCMKDKIRAEENIRLIVIDSFSYLFRIKSDQNRTQLTFQILSELQQIATTYNCAVVITNEITSRFDDNGDVYLVPALGDSHGHRVNYQITVGPSESYDEIFIARIDKSFSIPRINIPFRITKDGIRPCKKKS